MHALLTLLSLHTLLILCTLLSLHALLPLLLLILLLLLQALCTLLSLHALLTLISAVSRQAVFRCLRLVTDTSLGIRTVLENPEMSHKIVEMSTAIMAEWLPLRGKFIDTTAIENQHTAAAAKELTDALYVLNSMYKACMLLYCKCFIQRESNSPNNSCVSATFKYDLLTLKQRLRRVRDSKHNLFEQHKCCIAC
jgi:hypothetical protein